ncbi:MAG: hypothetical protein WA830_25050, partial [Candidatus Sulfotelmatobacter sp.]
IVASDDEQGRVLKALVDGSGVARTVHSFATYPVAVSDLVMDGVRTANPVVILVDIPADNPPLALRAIELLHQEMGDATIFAIGRMMEPPVISNAMRAGAREFIERPTTADDLLEAFGRLTNRHQRVAKKRIPRGSVSSLSIDEPRRISIRYKVPSSASSLVNAIPGEPPKRPAGRKDFGPLIGLTLMVLAWLVWVPPLFVLVLATSLVVFVLYRLICAVDSGLESRK